MTPSPRVTAFTVVAVYWLMLVVGMASCLAVRSDATVASIWTGTVAGTVLGHLLVLCNLRTRFTLLVIIVAALVLGQLSPRGVAGSVSTLAFVPAALCAFWSLGDRTTLVAFWFPAVVWMLSILDYRAASDETSIVLLAVLAVLFIVFVRVRETRRVALWCSVAVTPLARPRPPVVLKERTGMRLPWALLASAVAFAATAWLAPRLWQPESRLADPMYTPPQHASTGVPCCPIFDELDTKRTRVKEYFDIGRGVEEHGEVQQQRSCRRCDGIANVPTVTTYRGDYVGMEPIDVPPGNGWGDIPTSPHGSVTDVGTSMSGETTSDEAIASAHAQMPPTSPPTYEPSPPPNLIPPMPTPVPEALPPPRDSPAPTPVAPPPAPEPPAAAPEPPPVAAAEPPPVAAPTEPTTVAVAPAPRVDAAPPIASITDEGSPQQTMETRRRPTIGPSILEWAALIVAAALLFQLAMLAMRPLRRLVTLRHLRRPFWEETVDQRVSNAWQLALVGLRDAGWRASSQESPRELARRVGIDGVERCATILERTRHGIGIDADDLSTMTSSAETAYRDARGRLGPVARAVTWLRWPLV